MKIQSFLNYCGVRLKKQHQRIYLHHGASVARVCMHHTVMSLPNLLRSSCMLGFVPMSVLISVLRIHLQAVRTDAVAVLACAKCAHPCGCCCWLYCSWRRCVRCARIYCNRFFDATLNAKPFPLQLLVIDIDKWWLFCFILLTHAGHDK